MATQQGPAPAPDAAVQLIYPPNVQVNSTIHTVKFTTASLAGAVAGILGLQHIKGFALFGASTLLTAFCLFALNCRGSPARYVPGGLPALVNPGKDNAFTFVLLWTLFYGIVHVYD
ncbi:hypothetical protein BD626DRAFT_564377 [Schizophyllum amplum]|uniref:ER membrane protein complex subunit 6 n=1 Tax=Schizophyllum amplum TaxID=97359 RepID=A0A550CRM8_9AGAR|nr:hypothetical protein BD626DRAFT_564377 [Auriculariopsis ampla]